MKYFYSYSGFWIRWVAAFALLFQAMIPLAQAVQVEDEFGEFSSLIVCTAYGLQQINIGSDSEPADSKAGPESCPICLSQSAGAKILTSADMTALSGAAYIRIRMVAPQNISAINALLPGRQDARAPPLFA